MSLDIDEPLSLDELAAHTRHFAKGRHLVLEVSENPPSHPLWPAFTGEEWASVVSHLTKVANRCVRSIRNSGIVPGLKELAPEEHRAEATLREWRLEVPDGNSWRAVLPEPEFSPIVRAFLSGGTTEVYAELRAGLWPSVEEAIQDDLEPRPEDEFSTNAIEHLRLGNLRFALLEAVIGLEIVLARFLGSWLHVRKGLTKGRIEKFLTPELGLTARLAGVLELVLSDSLIKEARIDQVLTAVNWRNTVVHRTGRLPAGIPVETVRECVGAVVDLTGLLAREGEAIEAQPAMNSLAGELSSRFPELPRPSVRYLGDHVLGVWFRNVSLDDSWIPETAKMEAIAEAAENVRKAADPRFDRSKHLRMRFQTIPGENIVSWRGT